MLHEITNRLRFHGRYEGETQDECIIRKNLEREAAAAEIEKLRADIFELSMDLADRK